MKLHRSLRTVALTLTGIATCAAPALAQERSARFEIPDTVSPEARAMLAGLYASMRKYAGVFKTEPANAAEWDRRNALIKKVIGTQSQALARSLQVTLKDDTIGGVPVVRVTPPGYRPHGRVLVYIHGGGYVSFDARTTLSAPALMALETGDEVISVDYTLAPHSQWRETTAQVAAFYRGLLAQRRAGEIGMFGDSAGGGLVAGTVLRIRDEGLPLPGAINLMSPWLDVGNTGDSFITLADVDPILEKTAMGWYANAYAGPADRKQPYASPVYGDFSKPWPATLIQGGTRELLLSDFVRGYQAIRGGGHEALLDLYEGMPHVFQSYLQTAPEGRTALRRAADFFASHLTPTKRAAK